MHVKLYPFEGYGWLIWYTFWVLGYIIDIIDMGLIILGRNLLLNSKLDEISGYVQRQYKQ